MHTLPSLDADAFLRTYDELTSDLKQSSHQLFVANLHQWFAHLDDDPRSKRVLEELEARADLDGWLASLDETEGLGGGPQIKWPRDRSEQLGLRLAIFRAFTVDKLDPFDFSLNYLGAGTSAAQANGELVDQVLYSAARDLRHILAERLTQAAEAPAIPASDRVVTLHHNQPEYQTAVAAVEEASKAVQAANDYDDIEDKQQRLAELSAGQRLLQATRVRLRAVVVTLMPALLWLADHFAGGIIGEAASSALAALGALFGAGWQWPF